jgi:hypothetical protein
VEGVKQKSIYEKKWKVKIGLPGMFYFVVSGEMCLVVLSDEEITRYIVRLHNASLKAKE